MVLPRAADDSAQMCIIAKGGRVTRLAPAGSPIVWHFLQCSLMKDNAVTSARPWIRTRLATMMFLELAVWGAWYPPIGSYMNKALGSQGSKLGGFLPLPALGASSHPYWSATWPTGYSPRNEC